MSSLVSDMDEVEAFGVLSDLIPMVWPEVSDLLQPAVDKADGKVDIDEVYSNLCNRDMQLWITRTKKGSILTACVTRIMAGKSWKRLEGCFYASNGGDADLAMVSDLLFAFAKSHACEAIEIIGRKGFEKKLKKFGFEPIYTTLRVFL